MRVVYYSKDKHENLYFLLFPHLSFKQTSDQPQHDLATGMEEDQQRKNFVNSLRLSHFVLVKF